MIRISYNSSSYTAEISSDLYDDCWLQIVDLCYEETKETNKLNMLKLEIPWWSYLNIRQKIYFSIRSYKVDLLLSDEARGLIKEVNDTIRSFDSISTSNTTDDDILLHLKKNHFTRSLLPFQMRNVKKLTSLKSAATFSVPGAGKTTEALAFYCFHKTVTSKLLVVLPKNAFMAWEDEAKACFQQPPTIIRLSGGYENIKNQLHSNPEIMLITYQQLINVYNLIGTYLSKHESFIFIDESHRMKKGIDGKASSAILRLSGIAKYKLVMSGTPMPQYKTDLIPQFSFLYPGIPVTADTIEANIKKIYVRTTKADLGLNDPNFIMHPIEMSTTQQYLYKLLTDEGKRAAEAYLRSGDKNTLRSLGKSCMNLLQVSSNPALIARRLNNDLLQNVVSLGDSPKIAYACYKARKLASKGQKTLIWTNFVENVELIASRLQDLKAVYIHGGVPSGQGNNNDTREGRIRKFLSEDDCFVMVANPAAACEGISLHSECHYAIYIDRTFNAAHYLQSIDRIHRIGLPKDCEVNIEVLTSPETIDDSVEQRLSLKLSNMARVLEDPSIQKEYEYFDDDNISDEEIMGISDEDAQYLARIFLEV